MLAESLGIPGIDSQHGRGKGTDTSGVKTRFTSNFQWFFIGKSDAVHQHADGLSNDVRSFVGAVGPRLAESGN